MGFQQDNSDLRSKFGATTQSQSPNDQLRLVDRMGRGW